VEVIVPGMPVVIYGNVGKAVARQIVGDHVVNRRLLDNHICDKPATDIA
jgi:(2Fe-2S) ferredoxin